MGSFVCRFCWSCVYPLVDVVNKICIITHFQKCIVCTMYVRTPNITFSAQFSRKRLTAGCFAGSKYRPFWIMAAQQDNTFLKTHTWHSLCKYLSVDTKIIFRNYIESYCYFTVWPYFDGGHLGFMQITNSPQSCHTGKSWIWHLQYLTNTNPQKNFIVPTISGYHRLATGLDWPIVIMSRFRATGKVKTNQRVILRDKN